MYRKEIERLQQKFNRATEQMHSMSPDQLSSEDFVDLNELRTSLFEQITNLLRKEWASENTHQD
jgi:hypothetical protein